MSEIVFSSWGGRIVDNRGQAEQAFVKVENVALPEHFHQDQQIRGLMGWNGIILRDPDIDIIDLCRAYACAVRDESCGKCTPCRIGTRLMAEILERICSGAGTLQDLDTIKVLAAQVRSASKCQIGRSGPVAVLDAVEYFAGDFQSAVAEKRSISPNGYVSRVTAPCMDACPIHLNIPAYIEAIREARFTDSLDIIRERLPLPGVVGRVCVRPCEAHCRRGNVDESISIKYLKRFVADNELAHNRRAEYAIETAPKTGRVAIVGAGPAGLTCAYHLARRGHQVTVYESLQEPGGMSAVGIPDYRLPRDILRTEVDRIRDLGVTIHYGQNVGRDVKLSQLEEDNDAVFVGIGAQSSTSMRVKGEDAGYQGFIPGVQYLLDINEGRDPYPEGKRVVVIGGGNVAIDCVRCSLRIHKEDVNLVYRRSRKEMPADEVEIRDAEEENIQFHFLTTPVRILEENGVVTGLECIHLELGEPDASGRRRPVPIEGSEFVFDCDTVVPAIGQRVDLGLLEGVEGVDTTAWNTLVVDEATKQTSRPKIFSAGDCETGPGALITACAGGRKAARSIDRLINGLPVEGDQEDDFDRLFGVLKVYDPREDLGRMDHRSCHHLEMLPVETRIRTFAEVEKGYTNREAISEAERCLRCYSVVTLAV